MGLYFVGNSSKQQNKYPRAMLKCSHWSHTRWCVEKVLVVKLSPRATQHKMLAPNCQIFATYVYDAQENNLDGKQWHDSYIT